MLLHAFVNNTVEVCLTRFLLLVPYAGRKQGTHTLTACQSVLCSYWLLRGLKLLLGVKIMYCLTFEWVVTGKLQNFFSWLTQDTFQLLILMVWVSALVCKLYDTINLPTTSWNCCSCSTNEVDLDHCRNINEAQLYLNTTVR